MVIVPACRRDWAVSRSRHALLPQGRPFGGQWTRRASATALVGDFEPDGILVLAARTDVTARALAAWHPPVFTHLPLAALGAAPLRRPALYLDVTDEAGHALPAAAAALSGLTDGIAIILGCGQPGELGYEVDVPLRELLVWLKTLDCLVASTAVPAREECGHATATVYVAIGDAARSSLSRLQQMALVRVHHV